VENICPDSAAADKGGMILRVLLSWAAASGNPVFRGAALPGHGQPLTADHPKPKRPPSGLRMWRRELASFGSHRLEACGAIR
jgi:hypothetical protein